MSTTGASSDHTNTAADVSAVYSYSGAAYTIYFDVSAAATLSVDTWHHLRVARNRTKIYLFLDGTRLGTGLETTTPVYPSSGTWAQAVGKAQHYASSADATWYGTCQLDELRLFFYDHLYNLSLSGYTPPVNALADDNEQAFFTKDQVDSFSIIMLAPYGVFQVTDGGDWYGFGAWFFISATARWARQRGNATPDTSARTLTRPAEPPAAPTVSSGPSHPRTAAGSMKFG